MDRSSQYIKIKLRDILMCVKRNQLYKMFIALVRTEWGLLHRPVAPFRVQPPSLLLWSGMSEKGKSIGLCPVMTLRWPGVLYVSYSPNVCCSYLPCLDECCHGLFSVWVSGCSHLLQPFSVSPVHPWCCTVSCWLTCTAEYHPLIKQSSKNHLLCRIQRRH